MKHTSWNNQWQAENQWGTSTSLVFRSIHFYLCRLCFSPLLNPPAYVLLYLFAIHHWITHSVTWGSRFTSACRCCCMIYQTRHNCGNCSQKLSESHNARHIFTEDCRSPVENCFLFLKAGCNTAKTPIVKCNLVLSFIVELASSKSCQPVSIIIDKKRIKLSQQSDNRFTVSASNVLQADKKQWMKYLYIFVLSFWEFHPVNKKWKKGADLIALLPITLPSWLLARSNNIFVLFVKTT